MHCKLLILIVFEIFSGGKKKGGGGHREGHGGRVSGREGV